jgi:hypothetical protein
MVGNFSQWGDMKVQELNTLIAQQKKNNNGDGSHGGGGDSSISTNGCGPNSSSDNKLNKVANNAPSTPAASTNANATAAATATVAAAAAEAAAEITKVTQRVKQFKEKYAFFKKLKTLSYRAPAYASVLQKCEGKSALHLGLGHEVQVDVEISEFVV